MTALRDFLEKESKKLTYRGLATKTGVSRGSLQSIIKEQGKKLPELETLIRISQAYNKPLWEVQQMAGVDLDLPQSAGESAQRLGQMVHQVPELRAYVERLVGMWDTNPDAADFPQYRPLRILGQPPNCERLSYLNP